MFVVFPADARFSVRILTMIGEALGHYTVRRKIGHGGMDEVYLAHDPDLEREVAQ